MHFKALRRDSNDSSDMFVSWEVTVQERRLRIEAIYSILCSIVTRARVLKGNDAPRIERMRGTALTGYIAAWRTRIAVQIAANKASSCHVREDLQRAFPVHR